jgi:hypothetical protein
MNDGPAISVRKTSVVLLKAMGSFVAVCIALGVYFDLINGRFSGASFVAEVLWIAGLLGPLLIGGMASVWMGDRLRGSHWASSRVALRVVLIALAFASGALTTAIAIRLVVAHAPESVAAHYSEMTSTLEAATESIRAKSR